MIPEGITRDQAINNAFSEILKDPASFFLDVQKKKKKIHKNYTGVEVEPDILHRKAVAAVVNDCIGVKQNAYFINYGEIISHPTGKILLRKLKKAEAKEEKKFLACKSLYPDDAHNNVAIHKICRYISAKAQSKESLSRNEDYIRKTIFRYVNQVLAKNGRQPLSDKSAFFRSELGRNTYQAVRIALYNQRLLKLDENKLKTIKYSSTAEEDAKALIFNYTHKDSISLLDEELLDSTKYSYFEFPEGQRLLNKFMASLAEKPFEKSELEEIRESLDKKKQEIQKELCIAIDGNPTQISDERRENLKKNWTQNDPFVIDKLAKSVIFEFLAENHPNGSDHKKYFGDKENLEAHFQTELGKGQLNSFMCYYREINKSADKSVAIDFRTKTPQSPKRFTNGGRRRTGSF